MQGQSGPGQMRIVIEVVDAVGVEEAGAPHQAVYFVALRQQEFGEVGAVLSGNASDQCAVCHMMQSIVFASLRHSGT